MQLKKKLPKKLFSFLKKLKVKIEKRKLEKLKPITENEFRIIVSERFKIIKGDTIFVHSSLDKLSLDFPGLQILKILLDTIGDRGNLLFPTYNNVSSYNFLKQNKVFDVRYTPSYTGILSELARRNPNAKRSLHPTKSVVCIGKDADYFMNEHHLSPYPYDTTSPYYKILEKETKIIGIGVKSTFLSCVHTVDDFLKDKLNFNPYHKELFNSKCVDSNGNAVNVETYAHDMSKMKFNLPNFFSKYLSKDEVYDFKYNKMDFFVSNYNLLFKNLVYLALNKGITIYNKG